LGGQQAVWWAELTVVPSAAEKGERKEGQLVGQMAGRREGTTVVSWVVKRVGEMARPLAAPRDEKSAVVKAATMASESGEMTAVGRAGWLGTRSAVVSAICSAAKSAGLWGS
jgi:hypothetical protein